jgi:hypothetical protein
MSDCWGSGSLESEEFERHIVELGAKKWAAEARFGEIGHEYGHLMEKCEKCDAGRHVEVTLPSGRIAYDNCECSKGIRFHRSEAHARYRVGSDGLDAWCGLGGGGDSFSAPIEAEDLCSGQPFEALMKVECVYFKSLDDCQRCCDWLNGRGWQC